MLIYLGGLIGLAAMSWQNNVNTQAQIKDSMVKTEISFEKLKVEFKELSGDFQDNRRLIDVAMQDVRGRLNAIERELKMDK